MLTPSKDAITTMIRVLGRQGIGLSYSGPTAALLTHEGMRKVLGEALVAGAEHLTDAGVPLTDHRTLAEFEAYARREYDRGVVDGGFQERETWINIRAEDDADAKRLQAEDREQWLATTRAQQHHAEVVSALAEEQSQLFRQIAGNLDRLAAAEEVTGTLEVAASPTNYEVWRDACNLAVNDAMRADLTFNQDLIGHAEWWWERLQEVPVQKRDEDDPPDDGA